MTVSFTGINNFRMAKACYQKFGNYLSPIQELKQGEKNITEVKISFDLNNKNTSDYDNYIEALSRANRLNLLNKEKPTTVNLHMKYQEVVDDAIPVTHAAFKLNNNLIPITKDSDLILYTYLAKMTRETLPHLEGTSEAQKKLLKLTNKGIAQTASEYIDLPKY